MFTGVVTVIFLFLCVMDTCICNRLCVLVHVLACRSEASYVPLRFSILISDSRSFLLNLGLAVSLSLLPVPAISELTADRGKLLCGCGGRRSSGLHSKYLLTEPHPQALSFLMMRWEFTTLSELTMNLHCNAGRL